MELEIIEIPSIKPFPSEEQLFALERGFAWKIYYDKFSSLEKKEKAEKWKEQYTGYYIRINVQEEAIFVFKLITHEEVLEHIVFFKKCEQLYRQLAIKILLLKKQHTSSILKKLLPSAINENSYPESFLDWRYNTKGNYLFFENVITGQLITFPVINEQISKNLDPCYFGHFIENDAELRKLLPIKIYSKIEDWKIITAVLSQAK